MHTEAFHDAFLSLRAASDGRVTAEDIRRELAGAGLLLPEDPRLSELDTLLALRDSDKDMSLQEFSDIMSGDGGLLAMRGLRGDLAVPDFAAFAERLERIFHTVLDDDPVGGEIGPLGRTPGLAVLDHSYPAARNADYIPALSNAPDGWAVSVCTVDGQRVSFGDKDRRFSIQSCCKPINYCHALETFNGGSTRIAPADRESDAMKRKRLTGRVQARKTNRFEEYEELERDLAVHDFIDCEPSGEAFNAFSFNGSSMPNNPMINAGAIMCASLISEGGPTDIEIEKIQDVWRRLAGTSDRPMPDTTTAKGENRTGANNRSLAYKLFANEAFPAFIRSSQEVENVLDFYFHCCSLMLSPREVAVVAATLSNQGVCPTTGERVFSANTVKRCVASMLHCGMYDASGRFGSHVGLPAKSGVGGGILLVVPGVMGICTFSPRLDKIGNSLRGLRFIEGLIDEYALHMLDAKSELSSTRGLVSVPEIRAIAEPAHLAISADELGDIGAFKRFERIANSAAGLSAFLDSADYDGRRAIHLAACEDHTEVVRFLIERGAKPDPKDRWGNTPLDDARRLGNSAVEQLLTQTYRELDLPERNTRENAHSFSEHELASARESIPPEALPHRTSAIEDLEAIWSAARGDIAHLRRLAARGARLLIADYDDRTPLHLAAAEGRVQVVQFLVEYFRHLDQTQAQAGSSTALPALLSWPDRWGQTPLAEAESCVNESDDAFASCATLLREAGAAVSCLDGFTSRA